MLLDAIIYMGTVYLLENIFSEAFDDKTLIDKLKQVWQGNLHKNLKEEYTASTDEDFEPVMPGKIPSISLQNLWKFFSPPRWEAAIPAIQGLDLDIYSGEITCLLGPNGAVKYVLSYDNGPYEADYRKHYDF